MSACIVELATNQSFRVEDGVVGVHGDLVLRGVADETLGVGERDIGRGCPVSLVIRNDLDTVGLPGADPGIAGTGSVRGPR